MAKFVSLLSNLQKKPKTKKKTNKNKKKQKKNKKKTKKNKKKKTKKKPKKKPKKKKKKKQLVEDGNKTEIELKWLYHQPDGSRRRNRIILSDILVHGDSRGTSVSVLMCPPGTSSKIGIIFFVFFCFFFVFFLYFC